MKKKLLYLSDLYDFYVSQNKNVKFSAKDDNAALFIHIDEPFTYSSEEDDDLNLYAPIRLCHTEENVNTSYISMKSMKDAQDTAYEMPILAYIFKDPDNEEQYTFAGHEFYINDDDEIVYEEIPVGVVSTKKKLELVYDKDVDKTYLDGLAKIWRTYTKAAEILEREKKFWVSVELQVDELSYNAKDKLLIIEKFRFTGVTLLGKSRDTGKPILPGMQGANITLADFSEQNNSLFSQNDKVIEMLSALNEKLDNLNINSKTNGKEVKNDTMFEKLLEKYSKTVDEIDFEYDGLSDEELEAVFAEHFEDAPKKKKKGADDDTTPSGDGDDSGDDSGDDDKDDDKDDDDKDNDDKEPDQNQEETPTQQEEQSQQEEAPTQQEETQQDNGGEENPEEVDYYSVDYSVTVKGEKKNFSVSLKEKLNALTTLVNDTYSETDGAWYDVDVLEDSKTVEFHDWWANKHYRQSYSVKKDVYSLKGDRIETFVSFLSADEKAALEQMKSNYSATVEKLAQYEAEPEKMSILESESYSNIADTEEFKKFKEVEQHFNLSVEEVRQKANDMLLEYAMGHKIEYSANEPEKKQVGMKLFGNPAKKATKGSSRYGGLFSK